MGAAIAVVESGRGVGPGCCGPASAVPTAPPSERDTEIVAVEVPSSSFGVSDWTVACTTPITVPMATVAHVHPWMVGFATAYASSYAHMLIIGTPSNALAYAMAKDPTTGEQLVTLGDFFKHGFFVLLISFAVLWLWAILGYWLWLGFPFGSTSLKDGANSRGNAT